MKVEHVEGALILRVGKGEAYNERGLDMGQDHDLPPAGWHIEVDTTVRAHERLPPVVVIDASEIPILVVPDYGFLVGLAKRLKPGGVRLWVVARLNAIRAFAFIRRGLAAPFDMVATLDEALQRE